MTQHILFFPTSADFREWLTENHSQCTEQWIGYYKKRSGKASMTWPESVDEALCYGWIDGLRKSIDAKSYKIRFTPRKPDSHWSAVNIKRVEELKKMGLMQNSGMEAFKRRSVEKLARASYEQKTVSLSIKFETQIKNNSKAWKYWQSKAPGYQKQVAWWVMSAKRDETRINRLNTLIDCSERGEVIPPLRWSVKR